MCSRVNWASLASCKLHVNQGLALPAQINVSPAAALLQRDALGRLRRLGTIGGFWAAQTVATASVWSYERYRRCGHLVT